MLGVNLRAWLPNQTIAGLWSNEYDANVYAYGSLRGWLKLDGSATVTDEQLHAMVSGGAATMGAAPTMLPPTAERAAGVVAAEAVTATWRTNVQISAL